MLERTAGCLELGSVRRFVPGSKSIKSRRMLHSAFWNHGAMDLEMSPLWQALIQGATPVDTTMEANEPDNSGRMMLDFLYPSGAMKLIRQCSPWVSDRAEFRRHRPGLAKIGQRLYTSAAGDSTMLSSRHVEFEDRDRDMLMGNQTDGKPARAERDRPTQKSEFLQLISQSTRNRDYEEAWRQFGQLSSDCQRELAPQLLSYLITSSRHIDATRAISIFDTTRDKVDHRSYEILVNAYITLQNYEKAAEAHLVSLTTYRRPTASDRLLDLLMQHSHWEMAFDVWKTFRDLRSEGSTNNYDLWTRAVRAPHFAENTLHMVAHLTSHWRDTPEFGVSQQLPQDKADFISEALITALFPEGDHIEAKFKAVFSELEKLGLATGKVYQSTITKLLKMDRTKEAVRIYRKLRLTDGQPTADILDAILKVFCKHKANVGIFQVLGDWERYFGMPSSPAYRMAMTAFAAQGNAATVKMLWTKYVARQVDGRIRNADDILPLMHVHAKRGEIDEVVKIFENMPAEYNVTPNVNHSNVLLNAYGRVHAVDKAFEHYYKLLDSDIRPDNFTIGTMMGICTQRGDARAARELYVSAQEMKIRPSIAMIDCLVLGDIQDGNLAKAEMTCMKALTMALDGSKTRMWNYLLVAFGMKQDLENVSRIHRIMESANIPSDTYTYSALMMSLCVAGQAGRAWKILKEVMPDTGVRVTEFHYAVVMAGFIKIKESQMVFQVRDHMLTQHRSLRPAVSSNTQTLKAIVMEDSWRLPSGDIDTDFARTEEYLFQLLVDADKQDIASSPRNVFSYEPVDVAYSAAFFDFYMSVCGKRRAFDRVKELYNNFLLRLPENRQSQPPMRLLVNLMTSLLNQNDYDGVQNAWEIALRGAKDSGTPISGKSSILYKHRLSLCRPLSVQMKSLASQHKLIQLRETVADIQAFGFELDSKNWNMYVQVLNSAHRYQEAFDVCEERLMPGWLGWAMVRHIEPRRNRLSTKARILKRDKTYLRPLSVTILMLSKAYLEMEGAQSSSRQAYHILRHLEQKCPLTLNAIRTMRRTEGDLEMDIMGMT